MGGVSTSTGNRASPKAQRGLDLYETPEVAVDTLVAAEAGRIPRFVWEPACGRGAIVRPLQRHGHVVRASDIADYGLGPIAESKLDFLTFDAGTSRDYLKWDGIVTNPPFSHAEAFVQQARSLAPYVAMLLRLAFLEGEARGRTLYAEPGLARVHVFSRRLPRMHQDGWDGPKSGATMAFAWLVWERGHSEPPALHHWDWRDHASPESLAALEAVKVAA